MEKSRILVWSLASGLVVSLLGNLILFQMFIESQTLNHDLSLAYDGLRQSYVELEETYSPKPPISKDQAIDIALEYGQWNETSLEGMEVTASLEYCMFRRSATELQIRRLFEVIADVSDYGPDETCTDGDCTTFRYCWILLIQQKEKENGSIPPPGYYWVDASTGEIVFDIYGPPGVYLDRFGDTLQPLAGLAIPQPVCGIGDILWNASGCYLLDFEQGRSIDVKVSHVSGVGEFLIWDPSGGLVEGYEWENPPYGGAGINLDASCSGIYSLEIEGVCHIQVSRSLWMMVGEDPVTLRGFLGENRSIYGYYIWIFQSGSEHPSDLVEVEVNLTVPEGADFNLYEADMFFTEPSPAEDRRAENHGETLVYENGPEGLILFVHRASGEGEYVLTVRAYVAYWKLYWLLLAILVVVSIAILGIAALSRIAKGKLDRSNAN